MNRIKFDQQTGRSKGYAFVHYFDDLTAQSAVRNLHEVLVNGRNLRVELSTDEPAKTRGGRGGATGGGGGAGGAGGGGQRMSGPPTGYGGSGGYGGPGAGGPPGMGGPPMPPVAGGMGGYGPLGGAPGYGPAAGGPGGYGPPGGRDGTPPVRPPFDPAPERLDLGMLPPGQDVPPGVKATDVISKTLAAISPGQMQEVMAGMKVSWCILFMFLRPSLH